MSKQQNQNTAPRNVQRAYIDVPTLKNQPRRVSLAEISPSASTVKNSKATTTKATSKDKDAPIKSGDASKKKLDASVLPLQLSNLSNHAHSKKRAREDEMDQKLKPAKKRNVEQTKKQPTKKKSTQSLSSSSLTPVSEQEAPAPEIPVKKVVVKKPPQPLWTRVGVDFTREEIENRILLREFVIRFSACFDLKRPTLEKLEDFAEFDDSLAKAILLAFVEVIKNESPSEDRRKLNEFIKQIRAKGMSFYDILYTLNGLRTKTDLHIPDLSKELKAEPDSIESEALIPVLLCLIDDLIDTKALRAEVDRYKEEGIEVRKEHYASAKEERERWGKIRTALMEEKKQAAPGFDLAKWKAKFEKAKSKHDTIDLTEKYSYLKKQAEISPRFISHTDKDGRIYYIHSPSLRKPILKSTREEFSRWVWFVAVWGKRPGDATRLDLGEEGSDSDSELSDDELALDNASVKAVGKEGWWAFGDAAEVKKLAQWVAWKDGAKDEEKSEEGEEKEEDVNAGATKALVDALNGFVAVLQYADDSVSK